MKCWSLGFKVCSFLISLVLSSDDSPNIPFKVGEKLEYSLSWGFFPVGSAILEVKPKVVLDDELCYVFNFSVRTNSFADAFYKVRTSIQSYVKNDFSKSILYKKLQSEGKTKRNVKVNFDYQNRIANYYLSGKKISSVPIPDSVFDPLGIAYFFRIVDLSSNNFQSIPTSDGKRFSKLKISMGKKKKIIVPAGRFYAIETIPEMKNLRGVFNKSPDGMLKVWYSSDFKRIPIKITSKVIVGSFNAELVKISTEN